MVYGKILYNNIKEYTPKWYPTIPYSQTVKPVYGRKQQRVGSFQSSPFMKSFWRNFAFVFQRHSFMWQVFIVAMTFTTLSIVHVPFVSVYKANNQHRTFDAAMSKERAYKKKMKQLEQAEEEE